MKQLQKDFSVTAAVAGMLAVIVSYAGSAVLIFQAARLAGLSDELTTSWIWAVSIGSGLSGIFLSWRMRVPIITAWSTPGAALLIAMLPGVPFAQAVGAYLASAVIITVIGLTGSLDVIMRRIPVAVNSGMFAGILFSFGAKIFTSVQMSPLLGLTMLLCFILFRRLCPRYAIAAVLVCGTGIAALTGMMHFDAVHFALAKPVFTAPEWSAATIVSIGLPLALVTLTGQYISGMAVLHASGYPVVSNGIMAVTGITSLLFAPFGSHAINLSSLTAAICTGKESHEDPSRRYIAGLACGGLYILVGLSGTTLTSLFAALPAVFIAVLAGLALMSAFTAGLYGVFKDSDNMEAGVIAFLATASGMELLGLGAPFWGLAFGSLAYFILKK
ncbi:MAG: benzoate/H(+) symporter BenE family transporter [Desulfovibrio sp.]|uniref:benzoate/H(+) symporter BenE family transporter n=1 Tax=Desulfovibrio sp. TaxID=885 RepID=UPI0039E25E87